MSRMSRGTNSEMGSAWRFSLGSANAPGCIGEKSTPTPFPVAICTTTEANLGDGLFPLRDYLDAGGRWGVGSDSNSSVDPVEELRWLEYGQRLRAQRRNIASSMRVPSVGTTLLDGALASAADSTGFAAEDRLVLDADAPILAGATVDDVVDRWLFSGNRPLVRDVEVAGVRVVEDGRHRDRDAIAVRYREAMKQLLRQA